MTTPFLPYEIPRCPGNSSNEDGAIEWQEGCEACLRRTAPPHPDPAQQQWIKPPSIVVFVCEYLIEP